MKMNNEYTSNYLNKNQIYFVVYQDEYGELQLAQAPLNANMPYEERVKIVKSIDFSITSHNCRKVYHHYFNP